MKLECQNCQKVAEMTGIIESTLKGEEDFIKNFRSSWGKRLNNYTNLERSERLKQVNKKNNALQTRLTGLENSNRQLNKEAQERANQIQTLQTTLTTRNSELSSSRISLQNHQTSWQKQKLELTGQIKKFQDEVSSKSKVETELKNQISTLTTQLTAKTTDYDQFLNMEGDSVSAKHKVEELESSVSSLEKGRQELEQQLSKVKKKLTEWVKLVGERKAPKDQGNSSKKGWFW